MMQTVKIEVTQHRDEFGQGQLKAIAHVVDTATDRAIIAGTTREVHDWLTRNGFRWLPGSQSVWGKGFSWLPCAPLTWGKQ